MENQKKNWTLLDCTLRDGGYYNNWNFSKSFIQSYLNYINKTKISYVELGFRFFKKKIPMGLTAYTDNSLLNSLNLPKKTKIGIMINAGELIQPKSKPLNLLKTLFLIPNKNIKFVRFACHHHEVFFLQECISWLLSKKIEVFINIMQISEINEKKIKKICSYLKTDEIKAIYLADSLGSLRKKNLINLINKFKKHWKGELGLHAHNNLNLALENSLNATKAGFKWIDSTILGMGRGPGNLKTEEIIKYYNHSDYKKIFELRKKYFDKLQKHYKWGSNKYYKFAAINKIHPTYIQEMLSDKRYNKKNYNIIIKNLKDGDATKYDPLKLFSSKSTYFGKPKGKWIPERDLKNKDVLITGPGTSINKNKSKIEKFIEKNNLFVISVNTSSLISEKFVNLRAVCHPRRIISDIEEHNRFRTNLVMPFSMLPSKLTNSMNFSNKIIYDFGLLINQFRKLKISKNHCTLPSPLVVLYSIAMAIAGKANTIYLAGFDGFKANDPDADETNYYLKLLVKRFKNLNIKFITKSNYPINQIKI